jgi:hypothetical protein
MPAAAKWRHWSGKCKRNDGAGRFTYVFFEGGKFCFAACTQAELYSRIMERLMMGRATLTIVAGARIDPRNKLHSFGA